MSSVLEEVVSVQSDDTSLIGLGNIGKDDVDHGEEHSVLVWVTGILNDRDNVGSLLGHVDEITTRSVREFDSVDGSFGTNDIGNVRY